MEGGVNNGIALVRSVPLLAGFCLLQHQDLGESESDWIICISFHKSKYKNIIDLMSLLLNVTKYVFE